VADAEIAYQATSVAPGGPLSIHIGPAVERWGTTSQSARHSRTLGVRTMVGYSLSLPFAYDQPPTHFTSKIRRRVRPILLQVGHNSSCERVLT